MTGRALRIASVSAAAVVSAAVAGAALYGGAAMSNPGAPSDDRLIALPAAPSAYSTDTPSETPAVTPSTSPSAAVRTHAARPHTSAQKCNIHQRGSACYRPLKSHAPATSVARSSHNPSAPTPAKRRSTPQQTSHAKPSPSKKPSPAARSAASKTAPSPKTASGASGYDARSDWANAVLDELNAERAAHGLSALKLNSKLSDSAHTHNLAMAKADTLSHKLSGERDLGSRASAAGYNWSMVGENIAYNSSRSESGVLAVQKAMYNEKPPNDGHRENILNKKFVDVGIDVINDSVHGKVWLVTDFGRP